MQIKLQDEIFHCVCECGGKFIITHSAGSVWSFNQCDLKNECCEVSASTTMSILMRRDQVWNWYKSQIGLHFRTAELFKHNDLEKTPRGM